MMKEIKFKDLKEDQTLQTVDMNDYFSDSGPFISEPITKKEFCEEFLAEIIEDLTEDGDDCTYQEAFEALVDDSGGGDSNKVVITVIDGAAHLVVP